MPIVRKQVCNERPLERFHGLTSQEIWEMADEIDTADKWINRELASLKPLSRNFNVVFEVSDQDTLLLKYTRTGDN